MRARRVPMSVVPAAVTAAFFGAWFVSRHAPIPSFDWVTSAITMPAHARTTTLRVRGLECRHRSLQLQPLLFERSDARAIPGYLRVVVYPSPGIGEMIVTYDPEQTDPVQIARAVRLDAKGLETEFRVLLDVAPDLGSPEALLASIAKSLESQHEELFLACHVAGGDGGVDFERLVAAWGELFFDGLAPRGEPDSEGWVELAGLSVGDRIPFADYGLALTRVRLEQREGQWRVTQADWAKLAGD